MFPHKKSASLMEHIRALRIPFMNGAPLLARRFCDGKGKYGDVETHQFFQDPLRAMSLAASAAFQGVQP
ncbi:hypothetical protein LZK82_08115 [Rhizobium leguminosarum]|nr:transcriptional regulator, Crp/Fnr family domain protein [Rhizobium leguminosarum bv. viciae]UIK01101.1 hypothetical protein LZK82_08115 [Rhizobium leguminosarum]